MQGIGIDIERKMSEETARQIMGHILLPQEVAFQSGLKNMATFVTLIFSAKESLYKAIFPQVRRILEFDCAAVTEIQPQAGCLTLMLQADLAFNLRKNMKFKVYFEWQGQAEDRVQTLAVI
ncbi:4'-phosphopantetheinyl transferase superfamily protein [Vibrio sp. PP-XX7]